MIVLVTGMPRSGSTFSFNVAREVLLKSGSVYHEASEDVIAAIERSGGADHLVVKAHNLNAVSLALARIGDLRVVLTVRCVEDAIASWVTTFDYLSDDQAIQVMVNWLKLFVQLRSQGLVISFNQIDRLSWLAAWRIARYLRPTVGPGTAIAIARKYSKAEVQRRTRALSSTDIGVIDVGFSHFDKDTLFHRNHVSRLHSRKAEHVLPKERLARLRSALAQAMAGSGAVGF